MSLIDEYLRERGYKNETLFLRDMEKLSSVEKGLAEKTFANFPSDPCFGTFNQPEGKDDDERMFTHFQPRMGVAANVGGDGASLFRSKDHKKVYLKRMKREVMNPRSVDFDFLNSVQVNLREKFALLQLERFCSEITAAYPELTTYFYSNLSFLDANRFSFTVRDKEFLVDVDILVDLIGVERECFQPISVSVAHATLELVKDRFAERQYLLH